MRLPIMAVLARKTNHSIEMMSWIRHRLKRLPCPALFLFKRAGKTHCFIRLSSKRKEKTISLLNGKIKSLYFKYLSAASGSSLISSIYSVVDMAMIRQYQGLDGIGGSVLFGTLRSESEDNQQKSNEYFTVSLISVSILALLVWIAAAFFDKELLLFGAEESLLPLARRYVLPVKFFVPLFLFSQLFSAFLRNDGNPSLAAKAVLCGGIFNVFGDYFFVFVLDQGIFGAGLATGLGCLLSVYGIIININTFVQCCAYSIGQASQPIFSTNCSAGRYDRIRETLNYALATAAVFGLILTFAACWSAAF